MKLRKHFQIAIFVVISGIMFTCSDDDGVGTGTSNCSGITDSATFTLNLAFPSTSNSSCNALTPLQIPYPDVSYGSRISTLQSDEHFLGVEVTGYTATAGPGGGCSDFVQTVYTDSDDLTPSGALIVTVPTEINDGEVIRYDIDVVYYAECNSGSCLSSNSIARLYWYGELLGIQSALAGSDVSITMENPELRQLGC